MTLNSRLTCVYLPISTWADITSVVWSVEVEWMSGLRYGWKVLLKCKVFIPFLQTADQSSDSPSCLAASCFKAIWTLGLCRKSEGSNSRAVMQTGVTAFAQIHFLALAGLLIRCCYAGIVLFLIYLWPAKGPSASVSLTPRQALWAPHYSFQEESIAIPFLRPQRAELTCLCQPSYCEVRAQNEACSFSHQVHKAHNTTAIKKYFPKPFTFYLFCLRQQSLGFLPFKFFSWPTEEGVGQASRGHGFGKPRSSLEVPWCINSSDLAVLISPLPFRFNFNPCWRQHLILTFSDLPFFFCLLLLFRGDGGWDVVFCKMSRSLPGELTAKVFYMYMGYQDETFLLRNIGWDRQTFLLPQRDRQAHCCQALKYLACFLLP